MDFTAGDLSHLEALVAVTPSMLPYVPPTPPSDKANSNKAMRPYIDKAAIAMWSKGVATLRLFNIARMSTMSPLMLEYWGTLLKRFEAFIQSLPEVWVLICPPIPGLMEEEYGQVGAIEGELGQEEIGDAGIGDEANEVIPLRKSVFGKRKSVAQPPKSRARRASVLPASKQSRAKAPTPSKTRTTKGKEVGDDSDSDESSWGNPDPEVIERIKRLRPICGASSESFGPIPVPSDEKVPFKSEKAKREERKKGGRHLEPSPSSSIFTFLFPDPASSPNQPVATIANHHWQSYTATPPLARLHPYFR
ncbi:hypothetical protein SLEP1_g26303 [Rubroshorea leprosula]|uniref:Uncharacterized protein n=1 Tax=Rubroshorea leprosula TaxID=152421 RepID=A0AAV5JS20_9ROSI|nr:hypothetical protein SLEP1_g26303 [Rubroshorea leprosula]